MNDVSFYANSLTWSLPNPIRHLSLIYITEENPNGLQQDYRIKDISLSHSVNIIAMYADYQCQSSEETCPSLAKMIGVKLYFDEVNDLPSDQFIKIFGNIVEHYSALAIGILKYRPFDDVEDIVSTANTYLDQLSNFEKEKILNLHPDLAGKLNNSLTHDSQFEQNSAGLHQMSQEEKMMLNELNKKYKNKFGFPFVICARENKVATILSSIQDRLENDKDIELSVGMDEVKKICKLRIYKLIM